MQASVHCQGTKQSSVGLSKNKAHVYQEPHSRLPLWSSASVMRTFAFKVCTCLCVGMNM